MGQVYYGLCYFLEMNVQDLISEDECKWMQSQLRKCGKDENFVRSLLELLKKDVNR